MDLNVTRMETGVRVSGLTIDRVPKTLLTDIDGRPIVAFEQGQGIEVQNVLPDDFNTNANVQVGDIDVSDDNPLPIFIKSNTNSVSAQTTRPDNVTPYTAGDVVGGLFTFENVLAYVQNFLLLGANFSIFASAIPAGMGGFTAHFFNDVPTAYADNEAFVLTAVDRVKYIGCVSINSMVNLGATLWSQNDNLNMNGKLKTRNLYVYITTGAAYTPTALIVNELIISLMGT